MEIASILLIQSLCLYVCFPNVFSVANVWLPKTKGESHKMHWWSDKVYRSLPEDIFPFNARSLRQGLFICCVSGSCGPCVTGVCSYWIEAINSEAVWSQIPEIGT